MNWLHVIRYNVKIGLFFLMLMLHVVITLAQDNAADTLATFEITDSLDTIEAADETEADSTDQTLYFVAKDAPAYLYDTTTIAYRTVPDSLVTGIKKEADFWYADTGRDKKSPEKTANKSFLERLLIWLFQSERLLWMFFGLIVLAALIWFVMSQQVRLFGRPATRITPGVFVQEAETVPDDIESAIRDAATREDYRLAIRYYYLLLLQKLDRSGQIRYKDDTTNMEYLTQLYNKPFYKDFFGVMRYYEYVWYGKMAVDREAYGAVENDFQTLLKHPAL